LPAWWNGVRRVAEVVRDVSGEVHHVIDVIRQRVRCSDRACPAGSWTLYPTGSYPHRSFQLCAVASTVAEVCFSGATRVSVAARHLCSRRSVSRWVGWMADLADPQHLARTCTRLDPDGLPPPRPATGEGTVGRSGSVLVLLERLATLLLHRGVPLPGQGVGLKRLLAGQLERFGDLYFLTRPSPPLRIDPETVPL
jgi:hypothetical protein